MIPDPDDRTVKIPAEWRGGKFQLFGGGELPKFKDNAIVDLVFPTIYLREPEDVAKWTVEITLPFLPKGKELFVRVTLKNVPPAMLQRADEKDYRSGSPCRTTTDTGTDCDFGLQRSLGSCSRRRRTLAGANISKIQGNQGNKILGRGNFRVASATREFQAH